MIGFCVPLDSLNRNSVLSESPRSTSSVQELLKFVPHKPRGNVELELRGISNR